MNFAKIGVQGYSLGNLQLNSDELVWTSADKSRQERKNKIFQTLLSCCIGLPTLAPDRGQHMSLCICHVGGTGRIHRLEDAPECAPDAAVGVLCSTLVATDPRV